MTNMQIEWWKLQENKRHNLAQDILGRGNLEEVSRHNVATEDIGRMQAQASLMAAAAQQRQAELQAEIVRLQGLRTLYQNRLDEARINLTNAQAHHEQTKNMMDAWQYGLAVKYGDDQARAELGLKSAQTQQAITQAGFNTANAAFTAARTVTEKVRTVKEGFDTLGSAVEFIDSAWATITGKDESFSY